MLAGLLAVSRQGSRDRTHFFQVFETTVPHHLRFPLLLCELRLNDLARYRLWHHRRLKQLGL